MSHPPCRDLRRSPRFAALSPALVVGASGVTGHCLLEELSLGGARITHAPRLALGEEVRILLQLPGRRPFSVVAEVLRSFVDPHSPAQAGSYAYAVAFRALEAETQPTDRSATIAAIAEQVGAEDPLVLVVDASNAVCSQIVLGFHQVGQRAVGVTTPLDAIEWLLDSVEHFSTVVVGASHAGPAQGVDLLNFLAEEYPQVRRVALQDAAGRLPRRSKAHSILPQRWTLASLAAIAEGDFE